MATKPKPQDSANMAVWNAGSVTPTTAIKAVSLGGRKFSSINSMYMVQKATEIFGPVGIGWGWEIMEERYDQGHPIHAALLPNGDNATPAMQVTHTLLLKLWYELDGRRGELTQYGHTLFISKASGAITSDPEAPKKSLTDAMKKCLSLLGIASDVYLGMYDDAEYVEGIKTRERIDAADDQAQERLTMRGEYLEWEKRNAEAAAGLNPRALEVFLNTVIKQAHIRCVPLNIAPEEAESRLRKIVENMVAAKAAAAENQTAASGE
jgi:hypothetical protein